MILVINLKLIYREHIAMTARKNQVLPVSSILQAAIPRSLLFRFIQDAREDTRRDRASVNLPWSGRHLKEMVAGSIKRGAGADR